MAGWVSATVPSKSNSTTGLSCIGKPSNSCMGSTRTFPYFLFFMKKTPADTCPSGSAANLGFKGDMPEIYSASSAFSSPSSGVTSISMPRVSAADFMDREMRRRSRSISMTLTWTLEPTAVTWAG